MNNFYELEQVNIIELRKLYNACEAGEEFLKSQAGQILIDKLVIERQTNVEMLENCELTELIKIQSYIRAIDAVAGILRQYSDDKEAVRQEIDNRK